MVWDYFTILLVISLVLCAVGFYKSEYFHTLGYGFAISGIGVAWLMLNIMHAFDATWPNYVMIAFVIIYGIRLAVVKMIKEIANENKEKEKKNISILTKIIWWLVAGVGCTALTAPLLFTVEGEYGYYPGGCMWFGMLICFLGLVTSFVIDLFKAKKQMIADIAEAAFWFGILLSSLDSLKGFAEWVICLVGFLGFAAIKGFPYLNKKK